MTVVDRLHQQWIERYQDQLGRARDEVTTPALLLDLDVAKRNIQKMADNFRELPASLRPHIKVHKSTELSRLMVEAGAIGVACATAWEAKVMAEAGIEDVLVANQVVHPDKVRTVAETARQYRITIAVDDA
jgi:D-serine deaminase-like pyridoxal phosphate-dependent protein